MCVCVFAISVLCFKYKRHDNIFRYNCAIKLTYANSPRIENNTISSSLPLKKVRYGGDGATLDSDYVYAVGLEESPDFIIKNNTIILDSLTKKSPQYIVLFYYNNYSF